MKTNQGFLKLQYIHTDTHIHHKSNTPRCEIQHQIVNSPQTQVKHKSQEPDHDTYNQTHIHTHTQQITETQMK